MYHHILLTGYLHQLLHIADRNRLAGYHLFLLTVIHNGSAGTIQITHFRNLFQIFMQFRQPSPGGKRHDLALFRRTADHFFRAVCYLLFGIQKSSIHIQSYQFVFSHILNSCESFCWLEFPQNSLQQKSTSCRGISPTAGSSFSLIKL